MTWKRIHIVVNMTRNNKKPDHSNHLKSLSNVSPSYISCFLSLFLLYVSYRDGETDREQTFRDRSEQKSVSDGENFINPASFL